MNKQILVIAAHPDDEVLGCGGTIARLTREGHQVTIAILGEGITSRYPQRQQADTSLVAKLQESSYRVADLIGAHQLLLFGLPDNRFDTIPLLDVVKLIEDLLIQLQPQIIYTHHGGDLNIDHAITFRASLTAARPLAGTSVQKIYTFETPSATEWAFAQLEPQFHPNCFVDISKTIDLKLQAMQVYENEARSFPHPRSAEALLATAHKWGSTSGLPAAEAFQLVWSRH